MVKKNKGTNDPMEEEGGGRNFPRGYLDHRVSGRFVPNVSLIAKRGKTWRKLMAHYYLGRYNNSVRVTLY